jgi:hypothetical protein
MLKSHRTWLRRRTFREGKIVSRLIARDFRRDIWVDSVKDARGRAGDPLGEKGAP